MLKGAGLATVVRYSCSPDTLRVLTRPRRLFGWLTPNYPEDLSFYGHTGLCAFASISHEREAWVFSEEALRTVNRYAETEPEDVVGEGLSVLLGVV